MSANLFPNYLYGACRVAGPSGTIVYSVEGIRQDALTRVSAGVYQIALTPGADENEHNVKVMFIGIGPSVRTYEARFVGVNMLEVRTFAGGEAWDADFYVEINRVRTGQLAAEIPDPAPLPPITNLMDLFMTLRADLGWQDLNLNAALSGFMELSLDEASTDVSAALLNAAAAGTFTREFECRLIVPSTLDPHLWCSLLPVLTLAENCVDPQIGPPTLFGGVTPSFSRGILRVKIIFDTDAGATKVYAPGDEVTVQIAPDALGLAHLVTPVTKTYAVIV